jgi:hypothetical protein
LEAVPLSRRRALRGLELLRGIENGTVSIKDPVVVPSMKGPIAEEGEQKVQSDSEIKIRAKFEASSEQAPKREPDEGQQVERQDKKNINEDVAMSNWEKQCRKRVPGFHRLSYTRHTRESSVMG